VKHQDTKVQRREKREQVKQIKFNPIFGLINRVYQTAIVLLAFLMAQTFDFIASSFFLLPSSFFLCAFVPLCFITSSIIY
jgi:membrane protein insertase Oxa1/YidC/SpoIIIJ